MRGIYQDGLMVKEEEKEEGEQEVPPSLVATFIIFILGILSNILAFILRLNQLNRKCGWGSIYNIKGTVHQFYIESCKVSVHTGVILTMADYRTNKSKQEK